MLRRYSLKNICARKVSKRILGLLLLLSASTYGQENRAPNVVLICVDDLLPALKCYGNDEVHSPNIDKLANKAALFTKHYVTVPTCGASRYSLLRSSLPKSRAELGNEIANRFSNNNVENPNPPETFIAHLREHGYYTVGIGKISHSSDGYIYPYNAPARSNRRELPNSWDEILFDAGKWGHGWNAFFGYANGQSRTSLQGKVEPFEAGNVDDEGYVDGLTAKLAVKKINELAHSEQPFLLAVGFFKPHLPFNSPKKYWDIYDENTLSVTATPDLPQGVHKASLHNSSEFNNYQGGAERASLESPLSDVYTRQLTHAYYAAVSYVDAQIGKVLTALEDSGLSENTIIVLWSDHGWHLGDYNMWGKHTLFDKSLRSVLLIKTPQMNTAKRIDRVVSSIDIAPTILELCAVEPLPYADGHSLSALLADCSISSWDDVAYSYFRNGISMVTPRYRLTNFFRKEHPIWELYDHKEDPLETKNIALERPDVVEELKSKLQEGNTGLYN